MRDCAPSSPRYLVRTFAPNEKPRPKRTALGYRWVIYIKASRVSSVWPAEYINWLVRGTPAPIQRLGIKKKSQLHMIWGRTSPEIDDGSAISETSLFYWSTSTTQNGSNIRVVGSYHNTFRNPKGTRFIQTYLQSNRVAPLQLEHPREH